MRVWKKIPNCRRCVFFNCPQSRVVSRESAYGYGRSASGKAEWQWDNSDPFGNNVPNENPSGQGAFVNPLRFPGQYADKETNTYYNYFRDCYDPATGRYCQSDPIGLAGGNFSTFTYVNSNPLSYVDPYGLFVSGTYDAQTGTLSLTDTTTGLSISGDFFSGGKPFGLPIPNGEYDILEQAQKEGFFRLESVDTPYGDDKQDATGRDLLRLHRLGPLGMSEGCITAKDNKTWKEINDFVGGTSPTDNVDVQSKSRNPFAPSTESLKRFGRITVINSPN